MSIENHVSLIGNLGNDPETKYTQGGTAVTKISLATSSTRKDRDGNKVESVEWHRCTCFGKLAEIAGEYLRKGSKVAITGSIRYGKYEKDGVTHHSTDIVFDQMKMLDPPRQSGERSERPAQADGRKPTQQTTDSFEDDDIPW